MCDSSACEFPVRQIFFSPQNVQIIAALVRQQTHLPPGQVTGEFLGDYMRPLFEAAPAPGLTDTESILSHVHALNHKVAQWAAKDALVGARFNDHHLKLITGTRPVLDRPQPATAYGETRKTSFLLPTYTQFYQPIANPRSTCSK